MRRVLILLRALRTGLVLLLQEKGAEGDTGDLDDLEANTGDITDGVAGATEAGNEHLVLFVVTEA